MADEQAVSSSSEGQHRRAAGHRQVLKRLGVMLSSAAVWIFGTWLALGLLHALIPPDVWIDISIGFLVQCILFWCLLFGRDLMRKRRLEVVAYLANFFVDPKIEIDNAAKPMPEEGGKAGRGEELARATTNMPPASLHLALEKYMLDFDGLGKLESETLIGEWKTYQERRDHPKSGKPMDAIDAVVSILKRINFTILVERRFDTRMMTFLNWMPCYLPFAALGALFFAQLQPIGFDSCVAETWFNTFWRWQLLWPWRISLWPDHTGSFVQGGGFWTLAHNTGVDQTVRDTLLIATMAFVGSFVVAWRGFVRGVINYDLSPGSFLRTFRNSLTAIVVAVVAFHAVSPLKIGYVEVQEQSTSQVPGRTEQKPTQSDVNVFWMLAAFAIGVFPDMGLLMLVRQVKLGALKKTRDITEKDVEIVPLSIVDGIDNDVAARMEEFGISDIQHLATANPILLFVETPSFGLYQSIDWVAQAQLCTAAGPDAFLRLRQWRIRTVFDLERAVLSESGSTTYRSGVVSALVEGSPAAASILRAISTAASQQQGKAGEALSPTMWIIDDKTARTLVRVLLDDLHVLRLRQVWRVIAERLGHGSTAIYDSDAEDMV